MPANTWPFTQLLLRRRHVENSFLNLRKQHSGRKKAQPVGTSGRTLKLWR